jgi:hypothetical protein
MKAIFNFIKFLALATWVLVASIIITLISVTSPNWTPVNFLITQNPLIGRARKSIGSNIGYKWFNKNVFRTKALQFTEGVSASREIQKLFFKACQAFSKSMLSAVRIGMKQQATDMPAYSWFIGWLLRNAGNSYPGPATLDLDVTIISKGTLQQPATLAIAPASSESVKIDWDDDSGSGNALATDKLMVAWFNPTTDVGGSELTGTVKRADATTTLKIPGAVAGDVLQVWAFFTDASGSIVSDSGFPTEITVLT